MFDGIKKITNPRRRDNIQKALDFAQFNPDMLLIMADPKTDDLIAAVNGRYTAARVRSKHLKKNMHLVMSILMGKAKDNDKEVLTFCQFLKEFLLQLHEKMVENSQTENKQ